MKKLFLLRAEQSKIRTVSYTGSFLDRSDSFSFRDEGLSRPPDFALPPSDPWNAKSEIVRIPHRSSELTLKAARWNPVDFLLGTRKGQLVFLEAIASLLLLSGAVVWIATGGDETYDTTFAQGMWFSWGMFFDPGTEMGFAASSEHKVKFVAVFFSICGFLFNLTLLGIIVETSRLKLEQWRTTRHRIVATGHTLLLGWGDKSLFMLQEVLAAAVDTGSLPFIVILADEDVQTVKERCARYFRDPKDRKRLRFMKGSHMECADLEKVSASSARRIFILGAPLRPEQSDLMLIRTVTALASLKDRPGGAIVGEAHLPETSQVVSSIMGTALGIHARDIANQVLCLMASEPEVGLVIQDLVSFVSGNLELYCRKLKDLPPEVGKCRNFGEASRLFNAAVCIGVQPSETAADPHPDADIAPPDYRPLNPDDRLILISTDVGSLASLTTQTSMAMQIQHITSTLNTLSGSIADSIAPLSNAIGDSMPVTALRSMGDSVRTSTSSSPSGVSPYDEGKPGLRARCSSTKGLDHREPQTIVVVGWPSKIDDLLAMLDMQLPGGSPVHLLSATPLDERKEPPGFLHIALRQHIGETSSARKLGGLPLAEASAILVLSEGFDGDAQKSDSNQLSVLITLNDLLKSYRLPVRPRVVCEMEDAWTARMLSQNAELGKSATFVHCNAMETGMFTLASIAPALFNCLTKIAQPNHAGSISAVPVEVFLDEAEIGTREFDWQSLWDRARSREELLIGWHLRGEEEPRVNPTAEERRRIRPFQPGDKIAVMHNRGMGRLIL